MPTHSSSISKLIKSLDTNGDGVICGWGDENVDEDIDWQNDTWIDGYDNNGNGIIDEEAERYDNDISIYDTRMRV